MGTVLPEKQLDIYCIYLQDDNANFACFSEDVNAAVTDVIFAMVTLHAGNGINE